MRYIYIINELYICIRKITNMSMTDFITVVERGSYKVISLLYSFLAAIDIFFEYFFYIGIFKKWYLILMVTTAG